MEFSIEFPMKFPHGIRAELRVLSSGMMVCSGGYKMYREL
jgi:hypothetical protein